GIFLDENNILRSRGRLQNVELEDDTIHPILLPNKDYFATLIIQNCHNKVYHLVTDSILAKVRQTYWIPKGRALVKRVIFKCLLCKKI
ncbi:integrase zinc binding domain-containing protein, partial [Providencia rettgeri]